MGRYLQPSFVMKRVPSSKVRPISMTGLEHLRKSLRSPERRAGGGDRAYEDCLKGWLREDEEDKEPDERYVVHLATYIRLLSPSV